MWNGRDVIGVKNDPGLWEISLKTADFDVPFLSDDDRLESLSDNFGQLGVCDSDEWAGGVSDLISGIGPTVTVTISGTVCGDDDLFGGSLRFFEWRSSRTFGNESRFNGRVVGKLPQNGGSVFFEKCLGSLDGLSDAKTHTGVLCDENFVRWCEDALHFTAKLLHLCEERVKERRKICEMGAIVQQERY